MHQALAARDPLAIRRAQTRGAAAVPAEVDQGAVERVASGSGKVARKAIEQPAFVGCGHGQLHRAEAAHWAPQRIGRAVAAGSSEGTADERVIRGDQLGEAEVAELLARFALVLYGVGDEHRGLGV
jgi:hypothetical protein